MAIVEERLNDDSLSVTSMPHLPVLDGMRAVAISIVFVGHAGLGKLIPGGFGVTIFFFLSGFLITSLLRVENAKTGTISLRGFYIRRFMRINPPLWITMAFVAAMLAIGAMDYSPNPVAVVGQAFFFSNYTDLISVGDGLPGMPLWSLAVEEHFYLLFPLLFMLGMNRLSAKQMARICLAVCGMVLALRIFHVFIGHEYVNTYYWTHTRIDSILFGCILALWQNPVLERNAWKPKPLHVALSIGVILASLLIRNVAFRETIRYTVHGLTLFVIFSAVLQTNGVVKKVLTNSFILRVGLYSYTLYLVHMFFIQVLHRNFESTPQFLTSAIAGALAFGYAAIMYALVERPLGKLRRSLNVVERQQSIRIEAI